MFRGVGLEERTLIVLTSDNTPDWITGIMLAQRAGCVRKRVRPSRTVIKFPVLIVKEWQNRATFVIDWTRISTCFRQLRKLLFRTCRYWRSTESVFCRWSGEISRRALVLIFYIAWTIWRQLREIFTNWFFHTAIGITKPLLRDKRKLRGSLRRPCLRLRNPMICGGIRENDIRYPKVAQRLMDAAESYREDLVDVLLHRKRKNRRKSAYAKDFSENQGIGHSGKISRIQYLP